MATADLATIQANVNIGTSLNNTFVNVTVLNGASFALDMFSNVMDASVAALAVTSLIDDTTSPTIEQFVEADMNNGYLDLSFSEAVDRTSIDRRLIQLQSTTSGNAIVYNLTGSVTSSPLSATTIRLTLDANDLEALQLEENLCTTPANCHIRLLNGAVADYSGNTVSDSVA